MEALSEQGGPRKRQLEERSVVEATALRTAWECPGDRGLCRAPLAPGQEFCPACTGTVDLHWPSVRLKDQTQLPTYPVCPGCARPVPEAGETCRWCLGQPVIAASAQLQARIDLRLVPECPGNGGMCGAPLGPTQSLCAQCRAEPAAPAPAVEPERCRGAGGECRRLVLPGRGLCFQCRKAGKSTRVAAFTRDGGPPR